MATQPWEMDACELARLVSARLAFCREVVQAHLARIEQVNPAINALAVILGDEARAAADAADAAIGAAARQGDSLGPLCGVPMTVKENVDVAGSATTLGIARLRNAAAAADAPHIGELRAAGAIPLGRGNMPEFGMRWHTTNELRGPTRNPRGQPGTRAFLSRRPREPEYGGGNRPTRSAACVWSLTAMAFLPGVRSSC